MIPQPISFRPLALRIATAGVLCLQFFWTNSAFAKPSAQASAEAEAGLLAKQAFEFYGKKEWSLAITLYRKAFALARQPDYLFGAARAEHQNGQLPEARRDYEFVRDMLSPSDPIYAKVQTYLAEMDKVQSAKVPPEVKPEVVKTETLPVKVEAPPEASKAEATKPAEAPKPTEAPKVVEAPRTVEAQKAAAETVTKSAENPDESAGWQKPAGWAAVATGGALVIAAAVVGAMGASDLSALNAKKNANGHYDLGQISQAETDSQLSSINGKFVSAWVMGGIGIAAGGVGAFLLATAPSRVSVSVSPSGIFLSGRF